MMQVKRISLGPTEHLAITQNAQVYHVADGTPRKLNISIEARQHSKKGKKYHYQRFWWKGKYHYLHRIVAQVWVENPHHFDVVLHLDGNSLNNAPANLSWVYAANESQKVSKQQDAQVYYGSLKPERLTEQQRLILNYFTLGDESGIAALFHSEKFRQVCRWAGNYAGHDQFESALDQTYEYVLKNIRAGYLLPRYGDRWANTLFEYAVRSFGWQLNAVRKTYRITDYTDRSHDDRDN